MVKRAFHWLMSSGPGNLVLYISMFVIAGGVIILCHDGRDLSSWAGLIAVFALSCMIFSMQYGSPMNWWQPFFGTDIVIDPDDHIKKRTNLLNISAFGIADFNGEVDSWLKDSGIKRYARINHRRYRFLYKKDAARFKLAWWNV